MQWGRTQVNPRNKQAARHKEFSCGWGSGLEVRWEDWSRALQARLSPSWQRAPSSSSQGSAPGEGAFSSRETNAGAQEEAGGAGLRSACPPLAAAPGPERGPAYLASGCSDSDLDSTADSSSSPPTAPRRPAPGSLPRRRRGRLRGLAAVAARHRPPGRSWSRSCPRRACCSRLTAPPGPARRPGFLLPGRVGPATLNRRRQECFAKATELGPGSACLARRLPVSSILPAPVQAASWAFGHPAPASALEWVR